MGAIKKFIDKRNARIQRSIGTRAELHTRITICQHIVEHCAGWDKARAQIKLAHYKRQMRALGAK